jgi:hypothetical protein
MKKEDTIMGYILPINNEQYIQYVNRTTPYKSNYMKLYKVKPATLNLSLRSDDLYHVEHKTPTKRDRENIEQIHAEHTGKGLHFNNSI